MIDMIKKEPYAENYHEVKPSLFRESENLDRLLQALFDVCYSQQVDLIWMAENLLNLDEAYGSHLDFIGGIVGQPRFLIDFNTEPYFGFDKSYQSKTFGSATDPEVGGYWNSRSYFNTATSRKLNDDEYRRLIKARTIYNSSNCTANDLLEVINLITNSTNNTAQLMAHGLIQINTDDTSGILSYFVDRLYIEDNILPIAAGVRVGLEQSASDSSGGGILDTDWIVKKVYEGSTGSKVGIDAVRTKSNLKVNSSIEVTPTVGQVSDRIKSREYGAEVNKAVSDIDPEAIDWVLDPDNNRIKYKLPVVGGSPDGWVYTYRNTLYYNANAACNAMKATNSDWADYECWMSSLGQYNGILNIGKDYGGRPSDYASYSRNISGGTGNPSDEYKYIPIETVAAKVISNAEAGHAESKNLLVSVVSVLASMKFYDSLF